MEKGEFRRPCITITSTDFELLAYLQKLIGGVLVKKKNYNPKKHKNAFTLVIKKKLQVFLILEEVFPYLRIHKKKKERASWIFKHYDAVTPRNGKYNASQLIEKQSFENNFFNI